MEREISPPPLKRRKVETSDVSSGDDGNHGRGEATRLGSMGDGEDQDHCIRIFSWNINGIQAFVPASEPAITTFFKPSNTKDGLSNGDGTSSTRTETKPPLSHGNPLRDFLQRHRWPEALFLQEMKISPSDKRTPAALLRTINTSNCSEDTLGPGTRYTLDLNLPRDKHNARGLGGKLYGVGTLLREDFARQHVAATRHTDWDLEGRVTIVELRPGQRDNDSKASAHDSSPREHAPLALVNVYAVNGTTAPYRSPETGKPAGTRHDHKLAFHTRLRDECLDLERRGFGVVVAGDVNIARGRLDGHPSLRTFPRQHCVNRAHFNRRFFGAEDNARAEAYIGEEDAAGHDDGLNFDGVDVFRALRGKEHRYTYHPRGGDNWGRSCDRVDFFITSKMLYDHGRVVDTDILDSPQERGTSDHVPLWVKVKLGTVFDSSSTGLKYQKVLRDF